MTKLYQVDVAKEKCIVNRFIIKAESENEADQKARRWINVCLPYAITATLFESLMDENGVYIV